MTGGYAMDVAVTESAATALSNDAGYAKAAVAALTSLPRLGAPAAGEGIGAALGTFEAAFDDALGKIQTEMSAMSSKVTKTAQVTVEVERAVQDRFAKFAS